MEGAELSAILLSTAAIILVEALKTAVVVKAFRRSEDGNIMGLALAAEGVTFLIDATVVLAAVLPYEPRKAPALFTVCAAFLLSRLASSLALSRVLRK